MFLGHFALGFASKRLVPRISLGTLFLAPLLLDVLWPIFLVTGLESVRIDPGNTRVTPLDLHDYPYSHSLLLALIWSVLFGAALGFWKRNAREALVLGMLVFSHWVLDFVTHRPDLPLYPGSSIVVGLGLWNSLPGTLLVEVGSFALGVGIYLHTTHTRNRAGSVALWALIVTLALVYAGAVFGPPPPSTDALIASAFLGMLLFISWGFWIERNRELE
jgi:hypothetical protein